MDRIVASEAIDLGSNPGGRTSLRDELAKARRLSRRSLGEGGCVYLKIALGFAHRLRLGKPAMNTNYTVYILKSEPGDHHYVGRTRDLQSRLQKHNQGGCVHTAKFTPWFIETSVAFRSEEKAVAFELYLKSGSGREFARRHL